MNRVVEIQENTKLDDAPAARAMLARLKRHCDPVLRARGWRCEKLVEMCCCTRDGANASVAGSCHARGDARAAVKIAVRLRAPAPDHRLLPFAAALRATLHLLAHIAQPHHSAEFDEVRDALRAQYERARAARPRRRGGGDDAAMDVSSGDEDEDEDDGGAGASARRRADAAAAAANAAGARYGVSWGSGWKPVGCPVCSQERSRLVYCFSGAHL